MKYELRRNKGKTKKYTSDFPPSPPPCSVSRSTARLRRAGRLQTSPKGVITTYALVFGVIFLILLGGLLNYVLFQLRYTSQRMAWYQAFEVAEAGVNYYRWCLNNEVEGNCTTAGNYYDLAGNIIGEFSLEVTFQISCGETVQRNVVSTGWTTDFPDIKREISVLYARTSVAKFAYLINDNVWAGADREIRGHYHSNGGIRMDGENQSLVTSAQPDWLCTSSFGCSSSSCPTDCTPEGSSCRCPGVFTTTGNSNPGLFDFPVTSFDFAGITIDLAQIKGLTSSFPQEKYWPPVTDIDANGKGYHIKFLQNGTFEVWIITDLNATYAYSLEEGWHWDYFSINSEYLFGTVSLDPSCSLVFIEDNLWAEGKVKGKATVVSADLISATKDTTIVLPNQIEYTTLTGEDGLALIAESNVLISPDSPDTMELRGIFVAQKGRFGRNHYPGNFRDKLEVYGSIVSKGREGTKWSSGGTIVSGYLKRENYIDSHLIYSSPPFVPYVSSEFKILDWEEVE